MTIGTVPLHPAPRAWIIAVKLPWKGGVDEYRCRWISGPFALAIHDKIGRHALPWSGGAVDEVFGELFEGFDQEARRLGLRASYEGDNADSDSGPGHDLAIRQCGFSIYEGSSKLPADQSARHADACLAAAAGHLARWCSSPDVDLPLSQGSFAVGDDRTVAQMSQSQWHESHGAIAVGRPLALAAMEAHQLGLSTLDGIDAPKCPRRAL